MLVGLSITKSRGKQSLTLTKVGKAMMAKGLSTLAASLYIADLNQAIVQLFSTW